jgi:hypothetical protein
MKWVALVVGGTVVWLWIVAGIFVRQAFGGSASRSLPACVALAPAGGGNGSVHWLTAGLANARREGSPPAGSLLEGPR